MYPASASGSEFLLDIGVLMISGYRAIY